ncbi:MAG: helix-turn-helix transcriptional regulator [Sumerlaeia bacterium]
MNREEADEELTRELENFVPESPRIFELREGESVDFSEIGVRGFRLAGKGLKVAEWSDGSRSVMGPAQAVVEVIEKWAFVLLVGSASPRHLDGREIALLRRQAGLTQETLASALGVAREHLSRMERCREPVTKTMSLAVLRVMESHLPAVVNALPADTRQANAAVLAAVQDRLTAAFAGEYPATHLPGGTTATLTALPAEA